MSVSVSVVRNIHSNNSHTTLRRYDATTGDKERERERERERDKVKGVIG